MINDGVYYGNVLGLLKTGKWNISASEASALVQIIQETERRLKPPSVEPVKEPITKDKVKK
jgi:hypothetical protein